MNHSLSFVLKIALGIGAVTLVDRAFFAKRRRRRAARELKDVCDDLLRRSEKRKAGDVLNAGKG